MKMITFESKGNFKRLDGFMEKLLEVGHLGKLDKYGRMGVNALSANTPFDSGETADSWYYTIERKDDQIRLIWSNSNIVNNVPIAVILQYGHATKNGGWVDGIDYINPALKPIFDEIADKAWKEVLSL